jgi:hypothetical protein
MEFTIQNKLKDVYQEMHGIRVDIYYQRISPDSYKIKLVLNDSEVIITEHMKRGLTDFVELKYGDTIETFDSVYNAEVRANEILGKVKIKEILEN